VPKFIHPMKAASGNGIVTGNMHAVVGKLLTGGEPRRFTDNFIPLNHQLVPVFIFDHPLATKQGYRAIRAIADRDEIDEGMRLVHGQTATTMVIAEFV